MEFAFGQTRIKVTTPDWGTLIREVRERLRSRNGFAVATINLDHLVKLRTDTAFRQAYARHEMIVADGNPIVWLAQLAGRPVELIPGSDMIDPLAGLAADMGIAVAFLGSTTKTLDKATEVLTARYPALQVSAKLAPPMGFDPTGAEAKTMLEQIAASGAGLCFIAMGAPRQERLAAFGRQVAPDIGFVSIGAGLDFIAQTQRRAPRLVRLLALEWLWRMLWSPRRLGMRYLRCALVLPGQALAALRLRRHSVDPAPDR